MAGESATRQFTLNVLNVVPTLRAGGLQATYANEDFTLELSSNDPGDDRIGSWRIDWGDARIKGKPKQLDGGGGVRQPVREPGTAIELRVAMLLVNART
jgi:uncharacterized protein YwlG (UPF0340 family)